jgi:hypothetical protein
VLVRARFKAFAVAFAAVVSMTVATAAETVSADAHALLQWVRLSGDAAGKPFAVVDKRAARIWVFDHNGQLVGSTAVLLGLAPGDHSVPGVGTRVLSGIPTHERTTPAGRFASEPGHNLRGEAIVWVDYEAALAIHRLRPAAAHERRPERLASESPADNRISLGCVIVSEAFYDEVVAPTLGRRAGVVYVLPETRSLQAVFGPRPLAQAAM